ncbi:MAG: FUSC family protein, partial [Arcobacter sp.]|uniref:FUSC family protein n=1 Tax=Arcobacter sp. TaxID=1872629 RepID=UPI003D01E4BA
MLKVERETFKIAFQEWLNSDLLLLIYITKLTIAALIAMSVSMIFNLSSPQTSVFTVFIVMQMYSGMVFSKSFYRFLGTVIGFVIALILTSAFSQDRVWFMGFFTIWIA